MRISQDARGTSGDKLPQASHRAFYPLATVRCEGAPAFRSQRARDVACLLDVDEAVVSWICMPQTIDVNGERYVPDFQVSAAGTEPYYLDAPDRNVPGPNKLREAAMGKVQSLFTLTEDELRSGYRLSNAKDLLRYGSYTTPLGDRLRLLAALDEQGSLTLAECLSAFQEAKPVSGLASLILHRYVEVDLDQAPLGPETMIRRKR